MHTEVTEKLRDKALTVIKDSTVAGLATQGDVGPDVCAIFYVWLEGGRLAFKSRRSSQHMGNIKRNPRVALIVYSHASTYSTKLGVQLTGSVREAQSVPEMAEIVQEYTRCYKGSAKKLGTAEELCLQSTESTFFVCETDKFRLIDEAPEHNDTMLGYGYLFDK